MNIESLTASQILAITVPEKLFSSADDAKKEYRKLAMKWHPDRNADNPGVASHINTLYAKAEEKIKNNDWVIPGLRRIELKDGRKFELRYRKQHTFELGEMYITGSVVAYVIKNDFSDLVENARRMIKFKYTDSKMEKEFSRYLPSIMVEGVTVEGEEFIVYKKTPDVISLRDVIDHMGKIPSEHVAWIMSTLYNLNCFFKYNDLSHNAISPDSYFISPKYHSGVMLGGFWYSSKIGSKMVAVPKRTLLHAPGDLLKDKTSTALLDSYLIKTTGLEMLGDIHGTKLIVEMKNGKLPKTFYNWLRTPGSKDAYDEYSTWRKKILVESWGPPKFHKLDLSEGDVYGNVS